MKRILEKYQWIQLVLGFILIALGVLTMIIAINKKEDCERTIFIVWAVVLFVIAAIIIGFDLIAFSKKAEFGGLITAGICVGIGIFVLVNRNFIQQVINTLLPYIIISIGGVLLLKTIILAVKRIHFKEWLLPFVVGVIFIASGVVFLVVDDKSFIYIAVGILFVALGAVEIVGYITILVNRRAPATTTAVQPRPERQKKPKKVKKKKGDDALPEEEVDAVSNEEEVDGTPKQIEQEDDVKLIE